MCARMRAAKERRRLGMPAPGYPPELPELRRQIVVRDFDFEPVEYTFDLLRTSRIDSYRVRVDGRVLPGRYGWARALELIRKGFVRVSGGE